MRAPDRVAQTVLVVSLVLATGTPLVWTLMTPPADAGMLPAVEVTASPLPTTEDVDDSSAEDRQAETAMKAGTVDATRPAETAQKAGTVDATRPAGTATDADTAERDPVGAAERALRPSTRSARIGDLDATPSTAPERLLIPSIDVQAPIVAIGVEDNGEMEVPDDVRDVGWYRHGPAPGEPGATVIAGHVDSREQGRGAFFDLRSLDVGARVDLTDSNGDVQRFDVVARRTYDKSVLPIDELFSREGPSQLVLITCGGDFDSETRSYRDNVVIYAQPTSSS